MRRLRSKRWALALAPLAVAAWAAVILRTLPSAAPSPAVAAPPEGRSGLGRPVGRITYGPISESSGIARSRQFADCYWTHNDSGDSARIFAIQADGKLIRQVRITGARNRDWEDIAIDGDGHLYIGAFGNNSAKRTDLKVLKLVEPDPRAGKTRLPLTVRVKEVYPFRFPDGNFDCEGLFILDGKIHIVNKVYNGKTGLYVMADPTTTGTNVLKRVDDIDELSITAADANPAGTRIALLSYNHVVVFNRPAAAAASPVSGKRWAKATGWARTRQAEAVCFDDGGLRVTNESRQIFYLPPETINAHLPVPATRPAK